MVLSIKNPRAAALAAEVAQATGETKTQAVIQSLEERLDRLRRRANLDSDLAAVMEISRRCAALPDLDTRSADEILGYDEAGAW